MDRRSFLQGTLTAAVAAPLMTQAAQAQAPPPPAPAFPPVDDRSVWLIGDALPPDPVRVATRLAELVQKKDKPRDSYLSGGAVGELETRFAKLLGKEDCAFLPTGSLANHLAVRILSGGDSRVLVQQGSHLYHDESDAAQTLSGLNLVPLAKGRATPTMAEITDAVADAENGPYKNRVGCLSLESPVRSLKGEMLDPAALREIAGYAKSKNIRMHLDGARVLMAPPSFDLAGCTALFDTVYVSLYKYLDAPFGAVLAGSKADIAKARDLRHRFGGTIYQAWPNAVLSLAALDEFPARHAQSHARAQALFAALEASGKVKRKPAANASNIFELELQPELAAGLFDRMRNAGVRILKPENNVALVYVNATILRRPVEEYARLFLG